MHCGPPTTKGQQQSQSLSWCHTRVKQTIRKWLGKKFVTVKQTIRKWLGKKFVTIFRLFICCNLLHLFSDLTWVQTCLLSVNWSWILGSDFDYSTENSAYHTKAKSGTTQRRHQAKSSTTDWRSQKEEDTEDEGKFIYLYLWDWCVSRNCS